MSYTKTYIKDDIKGAIQNMAVNILNYGLCINVDHNIKNNIEDIYIE